METGCGCFDLSCLNLNLTFILFRSCARPTNVNKMYSAYGSLRCLLTLFYSYKQYRFCLSPFISVKLKPALTHTYTSLPQPSGRGVQHYVIKFVSDLRQDSGFLRVLRFPLPIKLTSMI